MARQYYKDSQTGQMKPIGVKVEDTLPVGTEVDYDGNTIPEGWVEVDDPNEYSTEETRIGTWIDGKPLYRKTLKIQNPSQIPASGLQSQNFPHGISNLKECINVINPVFINDTGYPNRSFNLPLLSSSGNITSIYEVDNTNIVLRSYNESWTTLWYLQCTLEYTKITD